MNKFQWILSIINMLISLVSLTSCTSNIIEHDSLLLKNMYLQASGRGLDENSAKQQAFAELSQNFNTKILSQTRSTIERKLTSSNQEKLENEFNQDVEIISSVDLPGIKVIKKEWNSADKQFVVIIGLDLAKAKQIWLNHYNELKTKFTGRLEYIESLNSPYLKYQNINLLHKYWIEIELVRHKLQVIDVAVEAVEENRLFELMHAVPKLRNDIRIYIDIKQNHEHGKNVLKLIKKEITHAKWSILNNSDGATINIECTLHNKPVYQQNQDWQFALVSLSCQIEDSITATIINQISEQSKGGHITYDQATDRAIKKLTPIVANKIINALRETKHE